MADTPTAAVEAHMAAINSKERARFAATIAYPFVHIESNGEKIIYTSAADVPDMSAVPFARSEVANCDTISSNDDLAVYLLSWQRYDADGNREPLVRGLWGVQRSGAHWKIGWRQYLGDDGATPHKPVLAHLGRRAGG